MSWNDFKQTNQNSLKTILDKGVVNAGKLVLIPFGKKGGLQKGVIVEADNQRYFNYAELVLRAKEIQEKINNEVSKGIGIYRIGFEKAIPSYYIGEYIDAAGFLKE